MAFITPIHTRPGSRNIGQTRFPRRIAQRTRFTTCASKSRKTRMVMAVDETIPKPYSPEGMTVEEFFTKSMGEWRSQRSSHNLAWSQFEAVTSEIKIEPRDKTDEGVIALCEANKVEVNDTDISLFMSWEGESDWNDEEDEVLEGTTLMSVVKDGPAHGRLLRSVGYAETIPAIGTWEMTADGVFVLKTFYDMAAAEERIWFATPDLRMRVSQIRTSSGRGVVTASFSTEIRRLELGDK